jgi:hypothetical protein
VIHTYSPLNLECRGALGFELNGTTWDTRRGEVAPIQRWLLTRDAFDRVRRDDIELDGI